MPDNVYSQQASTLREDLFRFGTAMYKGFLSLNVNIGII